MYLYIFIYLYTHKCTLADNCSRKNLRNGHSAVQHRQFASRIWGGGADDPYFGSNFWNQGNCGGGRWGKGGDMSVERYGRRDVVAAVACCCCAGAVHCNTLQHTATHCSTAVYVYVYIDIWHNICCATAAAESRRNTL